MREKNKEKMEIIVSLRKLLFCVPLFLLSSLVISKRFYVAHESIDYNSNLSLFKGELNLKRQFNYLSVAEYCRNIIYLKQK